MIWNSLKKTQQVLQSSNLQFSKSKQPKLKTKLRRPGQPPQNKQNANHDNQRANRPPVRPINSEISFIISAETTLKKMAIPSRKTQPEMTAAFHKLKAPLSKTTTAITKTSRVRSSTCRRKN